MLVCSIVISERQIQNHEQTITEANERIKRLEEENIRLKKKGVPTATAVPSTKIYRGEQRSENLIEYDVPQRDTNFKTYMSYKAITARNSPQYALQQRAYTGDYGIRMCEGYYLIALGSYYGTEIGSKYKITLSNGHMFYAMLGECKADIHTDSTNRFIPSNGNVVEFIVDTPHMPQIVRKLGTFSALNTFDGNVAKIEMIKE